MKYTVPETHSHWGISDFTIHHFSFLFPLISPIYFAGITLTREQVPESSCFPLGLAHFVRFHSRKALFKGILFFLLVFAQLATAAPKPILKEFARIATPEGAEIVAYMPSHKTLFVTAGGKTVNVIHLANPHNPGMASILRFASDVASVSVNGDLVAVTESAEPATNPGMIHLFQMGDSLSLLKTYSTCAHPDMVTFSPDGKLILVACEGEPDADYKVDPEGGIGWIDISKGPANGVASILDFASLDSASLVKKGVRASVPGRFTQNLEPEYIAFEAGGAVAWVSLQENNALARIDIRAKRITDVFPLGTVDHSLPLNHLDYKQNKTIELETVPLLGLRQPDGIASFTQKSKQYVVTANEGASREYSSYTDLVTVSALARQKKLASSIFTPALVQSLGDFQVSNVESCIPACSTLYSYGSRSMSVFDGTTGKLIWDSGAQIEEMLAKRYPRNFNQNGKKDKLKMDARSDAKGSEPETVTLGEVNGRLLAFLGLERMGGILVWEMTHAEKPLLVDYLLDDRDRGPEGIVFISAKQSPVAGTALLIVGYEYSKTLVVYRVE